MIPNDTILSVFDTVLPVEAKMKLKILLIVLAIEFPLPVAALTDKADIVAETLERFSKPQVNKRVTIDECFEIALGNHIPIQVALEQIELAKSKLKEAKRALFANASFRASQTDGTSKDTDFREREFILKVEQPIYYSGRLRLAVTQAETNLEVANLNYEKAKQDLRIEVEKAYYNLSKSVMELNNQKELLSDIEPKFALSNARFKEGLSTQVESLNVQSAYNQAAFQVESVHKDVLLAELTLKQTMGMYPEEPLSIYSELEFVRYDFSLDEALNLALENRPDLRMNDLLVEFRDYGLKIAKAKHGLKIDLVGSRGESGGAFKTETLNLKRDWFIGLQTTRPLGPHTLASTHSKQHGSAKLGQTDRTASEVRQYEFQFFNNLGVYSEIQEAQVALESALADLDKVEKTIHSEVKEAFFNYKKAVLHMETASSKIAFRQKEVEINTAQTELNEMLLSDLIQARIQLTQERTSYLQALADYLISIATLNKSTGYQMRP